MSFAGSEGAPLRPTKANCKKALKQILSASPTAVSHGLNALSEMLSLADRTSLATFPVRDFAQACIKVCRRKLATNLIELCALCIGNLCDFFPGSAPGNFTNCGFLDLVNEMVENEAPVSVVQNLVSLLHILARYNCQAVADLVNIEPFFHVFDQMRVSEKRKLLALTSQFTSVSVHCEFAELMAHLSRLLSNPDQAIALEAAAAFRNLLFSVDVEEIPSDVIECLCASLSEANDPVMERVLDILVVLTQSVEVTRAIVGAGIDYGRLLRWQGRADVRHKTLLLIQKFLADGESASSTAQAVIDLLIEMLRGPEETELVLWNLGAALEVMKIDPPGELVRVLNGMVITKDVFPFVVLLCSRLKCIPQELESLVSFICQFPVDGPTPEWFDGSMEKLKAQAQSWAAPREMALNFLNLEGLLDYVNGHDICTSSFLAMGFVDRLIELMSDAHGSNLQFGKVVGHLKKIVMAHQLPSVYDPFEGEPASKIVDEGVIVDVKRAKVVYESEVFASESLFLAVEAWYNEEVLRISRDGLASDTSRITKVVKLAKPSYTQVGMWHRLLGTPGYQRFSFRLGDKVYSAFDGMYCSILRSLDSPDLFDETTPVIELVPECPAAVLSRVDVPQTYLPHKKILDLLAAIHALEPSLDMLMPDYETTLKSSMTSFFLNVGLFSPAVQIVANYPFLFSSDLRTLVFRIASLDICSSSNEAFLCSVERDNILDDGHLLLNTLAANPIPLNVAFVGENGVGAGPTKEFYQKLADEFCKKERQMWRTDSTQSDYAFTSQGLFPSPVANIDNFRAFGVLCAKVISMNTAVSIPLSSAFFKLVLGQSLDISDVDPQLARSLSDPEGLYGLTFVYPGHDDLELLEGGQNIDVDATNVHQFVALVREFTVSRRVADAKAAFLTGFHSVIHPGTLSMLSATDLSRLIIGADVKFQANELWENTELAHGYDKHSEVIASFFDILCSLTQDEMSLFVKFVTGSDKLPVGGLGSLTPKLTIARNHDNDALPSVMTCTHYLKLPPYTDKSTMKRKLITAIYEGRDSFMLT